MTTYDFIASNKRKTILLIFIFSALILLIGWFLDRAYEGGGLFLGFAAVYSVTSALVSYYAGDKVALAASGAKPVTKEQIPLLVNTVENLCITAGLPMPKVYAIIDPAINAFATGRDPQHASVAVTTGALEKLQQNELEGVIAHELSHVRNYDIRVMTLVIVLVGIISVIANMFFRFSFRGSRRRREGGEALLLIGLLLMIFAPIVAELIKLAVSRKREFLADASGALLTRYPDGLANALRKIAAESLPMTQASSATAHLFFANPFSGRSWQNFFSTHPPIEQRIAALEKMSGRV